jgi:hypothetical protein
MKSAAGRIVGKTIAGIIVKKGNGPPRSQVFLLFDDDTYYEFYADAKISGAGGVDQGGPDAVRAYMPDNEIVFEA